MKPNKAFFIIATVFFTFAILLGGVYAYISRTLTPEKMRELIVTVLNDNFPKAEVVVGDVDFKFGTSIDFVIKEINVTGASPLFHLEDAHIRIPIWAILKGGGIVELSIDSPQINWLQTLSENNWKLAMAGARPSDSIVNKNVSDVHAGLPAFIMASRLNIKMRDTVITYEFSDKEKGELLISKFLVKEIGFENPAAFEIDTRLQMEEEHLGAISSHILLIGEADLHRYVNEKRFSLVTVATISKTLAPDILPVIIPEFRSELKLDVTAAGLMNGSSKLNFKNSTIAFNLLREDGFVGLKDIQASLVAQDLTEIAGQPIARIIPGRSVLNITGEIAALFESPRADLKFDLSPGASYQLTSNISAALTSSGTLKEDKLDLTTQLKFLQGQLDLSSYFDFKNFQSPLRSKSTELKLMIEGRNFNITNEDLRQITNAKKDSRLQLAGIKILRDFTSSSMMSIESSFLASFPTTLVANATINEQNKLSSKLDLNVGEGTLKFEANSDLSEGLKGNAKLTTKILPGEVFNFLIDEGEGTLNGAIDANVTASLKGTAEKHDYRFDLDASKVSIAKINPVQWFNTVSSETLPLTKNKAGSDSKLAYSSITAKGSLRNKLLKFTELTIEDIANKYEIKGKGALSFDTEGEGELFLNYKSEMDIGVDVLPLKMVGPGLNLRPEIEYTIRNLTKKK